MSPLPLNTVRAIYRRIVEQFKQGSIPDPDIDAALLLAHVLGLSRSDLVLQANLTVDDSSVALLLSLVEKRLMHIPFAYLTGEQEFFGRSFAVDPTVLIPRAETELLVEKALVLAAQIYGDSVPLSIADLGTGSGVIAITLAKELSCARVYGIDRSVSALQTAQANARSHEVFGRVELIASDWLSAFLPRECFEIVISNPPYVAERVRESLQKELQFEPASALFAGDDGTIDLRYILDAGAHYLKPGGILLSEIGYDQKEFIQNYAARCPFLEDIEVFDDYAGLPRIFKARRVGHALPY